MSEIGIITFGRHAEFCVSELARGSSAGDYTILDTPSALVALASIVLGLVVVWGVARKHRAIRAIGTGVVATLMLDALLFCRASYLATEEVKAGCFEFCGAFEYLIHGAAALVAVIAVSIIGSVVAVLVRRHARPNQTSTGS